MYSNFQNNHSIITGQQQLIASEAADSVKVFLQEKLRVLSVAAYIGNFDNSTKQEWGITLSRLLNMEPSFRHIKLLNAQHEMLYTISRTSSQTLPEFTPEVKAEIGKRLTAGNTYVGSVYIDQITFEPMVIIAVPLKNVFGDLRGSLVAEVNLKFMWDLVAALKIGENGLAYVVNKDGDLLAFSDISRVLRGDNLSALREVNDFMNDATSTENKPSVGKGISGTTVIASYVPLGEPDWAVLVELPLGEAYNSVIKTLITSILVTLFSLTLAIFLGRYLAHLITDPLIKLRDATRTISEGNLNTRIEIKSANEIGELATNFNRMVESISTLLAKTKHAVNVIWEQSSLLRENSGQSAENMSSLAISIEQISKGATEQTAESEKSSSKANLLADKIDLISTKAKEIEAITQNTKSLTFNSKETVQLLQEKTTQTDQITGEITSDINELNLSLGIIRGITEVITNITEQTNLLALNAAIEAARAGEAGRGFAVVAMEIDKLASQSLESAKTIESILNRIETLILKSTDNATQAHIILDQQRAAVDLTSNAFDQIIATLDLIINHNSQMFATVTQIEDFKTETLHLIMNISAISQQSAASCEEVTAITEEQTVFSDKLKDLAKELNDLAGDLMEISSNFIIAEH